MKKYETGKIIPVDLQVNFIQQAQQDQHSSD